MSTFAIGIVVGYLVGTAGMLLTFYLARGTRAEVQAITANGIPAPRL